MLQLLAAGLEQKLVVPQESQLLVVGGSASLAPATLNQLQVDQHQSQALELPVAQTVELSQVVKLVFESLELLLLLQLVEQLLMVVPPSFELLLERQFLMGWLPTAVWFLSASADGR